MALTIPIAHDFICPWCWVGLLQAKRLEEEFGVTIEWKGYELFPKDMEWGDYPPGPAVPANKPPTLSRFDFLLVADDLELPKSQRPNKMRTYNAHQAVEYAKTEGVGNELVEALYKAYWLEGKEINDLAVLTGVATGIVRDLTALQKAVETNQFDDQVVDYDDPAYAVGVYNVPTFFIGGERLAEQPYVILKKAVAKVLEAGA